MVCFLFKVWWLDITRIKDTISKAVWFLAKTNSVYTLGLEHNTIAQQLECT